MKNNEENHLMYFIAFIPCFQPKDISETKQKVSNKFHIQDRFGIYRGLTHIAQMFDLSYAGIWFLL
jgi:hypothetical protein